MPSTGEHPCRAARYVQIRQGHGDKRSEGKLLIPHYQDYLRLGMLRHPPWLGPRKLRSMMSLVERSVAWPRLFCVGSVMLSPPPFTLLVALVWQCRGWLLAAVGRAVSPCHF